MGCASSAKPDEYRKQPEAAPPYAQNNAKEEQFCFKDAEDNYKDGGEQKIQFYVDKPPTPRFAAEEYCNSTDSQQAQEAFPASVELKTPKNEYNLEPKPILMQKRVSAPGKRRVKIRRQYKTQLARLTDNDLDEEQESDSGNSPIGAIGEAGHKSKLDHVDNMNVSLGDEFDL